MRKYLLILFCFLSLPLFATKYYIDEAGTDDAGEDGSISEPWATLDYACTRVASAGDTIYINNGTYTESNIGELSVGVHVVGQSEAGVIITTGSALNPILKLYSASEGTNGNQTICNITFDGDLTAYKGISVNARGNVKVHDCTFLDFEGYGITFSGLVSGTGEPTTHAEGNEMYDCTVTNCGEDALSDGYYIATSAVSIGGQEGFLFYDNVIDNVTGGRYAYGIKTGDDGFNNNLQVYDNTIEVNFRGLNNAYDFAIESWNAYGIHIYNNNFVGSIDLGGRFSARPGDNGYGAYIHDNTIGQEAVIASSDARGILLEADCDSVIIRNNYIRNVAVGIFVNPVTTANDITYLGRDYHIYEDIYFLYNLFENIGVSDLGADYMGRAIWFNGDGYTHILDTLCIWNNVIEANTGTKSTMFALNMPSIGTATNVSIRNNIIVSFDYAPIYGSAGTPGDATVDVVSIENNIMYGNGNSNNPSYAGGWSPSNVTIQNNIKSDPQFDAGSGYLFFPESDSPVINAGLDVGLTLDYLGNEVPFGASEDIGAYEYGSSPPSPPEPPEPVGDKAVKYGTKAGFYGDKLVFY